MKNSLVQLQVFYEIAMSIGNSLDINKMLQESLTAYLRKLNCFAGAVVKIEERALANVLGSLPFIPSPGR